MGKISIRIRLIITTGLMLIVVLGGSCALTRDFDNRLNSIIEPYGFSITNWELRTISGEIRQLIFNGEEGADDPGKVTQYFSLVDRIKTLELTIEAINTRDGQGNLVSLEAELAMLQERKQALDDTVERILARQIKETLAQQGVFNPIAK